MFVSLKVSIFHLGTLLSWYRCHFPLEPKRMQPCTVPQFLITFLTHLHKKNFTSHISITTQYFSHILSHSQVLFVVLSLPWLHMWAQHCSPNVPFPGASWKLETEPGEPWGANGRSSWAPPRVCSLPAQAQPSTRLSRQELIFSVTIFTVLAYFWVSRFSIYLFTISNKYAIWTYPWFSQFPKWLFL